MSKIPRSNKKIEPLRALPPVHNVAAESILLNPKVKGPRRKSVRVIVTRRSGAFNVRKDNRRKSNMKGSASSSQNSTMVARRKRPLENGVVAAEAPGVSAPKILKAITNQVLPRVQTRGNIGNAVSAPVSSMAHTSRAPVPLMAHTSRAPAPLMAHTSRPKAAPTKVTTAKTTAPKIPPYDFKARFNNLKDIHIKMKADYEDDKKKFSEYKLKYSDDQELIQKLQEEIKCLQSTISNIQVQLDTEKSARTSMEMKYNAITSQLEDTKSKYQLIVEERDEAIEKLMCQEETRRYLHNQIQELKGNIRVFCRCRPQTDDELERVPTNFQYIDDETLHLLRGENSKLEFGFDRIYPPNSDQETVFEDLAQLVQSSLDGYNVCVFAYGQTGSGKTFTMNGGTDPGTKGVIPRAVDLLFHKIKEFETMHWQYTVELSVLEIYNENIRDLLNQKDDGQHTIKYNDGRGSSVTNLKVMAIATPSDFYRYMQIANKNRATAATNCNEHSSRSHSITQIALRGNNTMRNQHLTSTIYLVDLAGSESAKTSQRMHETKAINKSLACLGNVMLALQNRDKHVPYRNSKLTYVLQSALGGNSKTLMFVNVSPLEENYQETVNSLRFAAKVRKVTTKAKRCATIE